MGIRDLLGTISLAHLQRMTDCFGIIQHADFTLPDLHTGYTTDDNARALAAVANHHLRFQDPLSQQLAYRYLAFIRFAQLDDGRFHNFYSYQRQPLDDAGSEDCFGRAMASLAYLLYAPPDQNLIGPAERLFYNGLPWIERLVHPRSKAFSMIALYQWWHARPAQQMEVAARMQPLADALVSCYHEHSSETWQWPLPEMTYANARLPEALFRAYQVTGVEQYRTVAVRTLDFLCEKTFRGISLHLVGNHGWYSMDDSEPAEYDQQPIDAAAMVDAELAAFDATDDEKYLRYAWHALEWFFGANAQGVSLYDPETGGCYDGLTREGVNLNQGAESTIVLLQAQLSMLEARQKYLAEALEREATAAAGRAWKAQGVGGPVRLDTHPYYSMAPSLANNPTI